MVVDIISSLYLLLYFCFQQCCSSLSEPGQWKSNTSQTHATSGNLENSCQLLMKKDEIHNVLI